MTLYNLETEENSATSQSSQKYSLFYLRHKLTKPLVNILVLIAILVLSNKLLRVSSNGKTSQKFFVTEHQISLISSNFRVSLMQWNDVFL